MTSVSRDSWPGAQPSIRPLSRGARRLILPSSRSWRRRSARRCAPSASTKVLPLYSTSPVTTAGAASKRPSAKDPYLVATIGTAYVRGLESAGVVATLKHFVGYSASRAGRNFAPVSAGPREVADILLPPFEMAIRDGARSVMHAYTEIDGVPGAANNVLLTDLLRDEWGFEGTVVADYFGVTFSP